MVIPERAMSESLPASEITVKDPVLLADVLLVEVLVEGVLAREVLVGDAAGHLADVLLAADALVVLLAGDHAEAGVAVGLLVGLASLLQDKISSQIF